MHRGIMRFLCGCHGVSEGDCFLNVFAGTTVAVSVVYVSLVRFFLPQTLSVLRNG